MQPSDLGTDVGRSLVMAWYAIAEVTGMAWTSDVVLVRDVWEQVGRPVCPHMYVELEYNPISRRPTGNLACLDCGGVWPWFDPENYTIAPPRSDTSND